MSWGRLSRAAWGAVLGLSFPLLLPAQSNRGLEKNPRGLAEIPLEQLAQVPIEFVTGASKYEQSIRQAPASVTVLTADEIANHNWRTLAEALQSTPGFHLRSDRFYDYIGNRGFTRAFDYNSRTLVLVNGHRINDPIYQQGAVGTDFLLDPEMIKRIEIIRGPGSSVYGSSAFYGAVNVIPKGPSDFVGGQISSTVDSQRGLKVRATVGNRTAQGLEYLLSATAFETPGETWFKLPSSWKQETGLNDVAARDQDGTRSRQFFSLFRHEHLEWESAYGRRHKEVLPPVYNTSVSFPSWGLDERAYSVIRYTNEPTPDSSVWAKVGYDHYRYAGLFTPARSGFERISPYARSASLHAELRWRHTFRERHILLAGIEHQQNLVQRLGRDNLDTGVRDVYVDTHSSFTSPFAQIDWELARTLHASTGLRWDSYSTGEDRATPRLGLMWDPTKETSLKVIFGESFRVPNVDERYSQELGFVRNPSIRPESNQSLEFVVSHRLNDQVTLDANAFSTRSSDLIQIVPVSARSPLFTYANRQRIVTDGVELATTAFLKSNVQVRASATFQESSDDSFPDEAIYDAPGRLYKFSVSSPLFTPQLRGTFETLYTSERLDSMGKTADGYLVVNASLKWAGLFKRWDLALTAYNLAGETWCDPKNEGQIEAPPRVVALRATLNF